MSERKDRGRRFLVVGLSAVNGVRTGGEVWESDLRDAGVLVEPLIYGGHLRETEPEDRPTSRRTAKDAGKGDE